jgi:23S rRNA pseudouridine1911/1915/1917 synthase
VPAFEITEESAGQRLDLFLAGRLDGFTRARVQHLLADGLVAVNASPARASRRLRPGDTVLVELPPAAPTAVAAEDIPLVIVYQDDDLLVINKPRGMVVHPAAGHSSGTLVNALLHHVRDLSGINGVLRPGIVHRLDRDTSGLLVVAKNDAAHQSLAGQLKDRRMTREYLALVHGRLEGEGVVEAPVGRHPVDRKRQAVVAGGKPALTAFRALAHYKGYTLLALKLGTGRTHQIRVHMAHIGHPVAGDSKYGGGSGGQFLHAAGLSFDHPADGRRMVFKAPLPAELAVVLAKMEDV